MEDSQIIRLFFARDETAITETEKKYGKYCYKIAFNILLNDPDAEECVNDTYLKAWNAIPPQRPDRFGAWLGRVVRNIALDLWNKNHRKKRYAGMEKLLDELEDCIPSPVTVEHEMEEKELSRFINAWLALLPDDERILFVRRYWKGERLKELAKAYGLSSGKMAKRMYRLRQDLKKKLEKEGYLL